MRFSSRLPVVFCALVVPALATAPRGQGQTFNGRLEAGDATLGSGEFIDLYTVQLQSGQRVKIEMASGNVDSYLLLQTPGGTVHENDACPSDFQRSCLDVTAGENGDYLVGATTFTSGQSGPYTLNIAVQGGSATCAVPLAYYTASGRATDTRGQALAGALVSVDNLLLYNSYVQGTTGAAGCYTLDLPHTAATWAASATITRTYHGRLYHFDLATDPDAPFAGNEGAVRHFTWKLSGPRPEGGFYGHHVLVYTPLLSPLSPDEVELTLVPDGPLVDGSAGERRVERVASTPDGWGVADVPVGRYTLSARHAATGQPLDVRARDVGTYAPSVTLDFEAPYGTLPIYYIEVEVQPATGTAAEGPAAARDFRLQGPAPNPADGAARVELVVPRAQPVEVAVFDALGRRRAVLFDGLAEAGLHVLSLDAAALPAGRYAIRARGEEGVQTRLLTVAH